MNFTRWFAQFTSVRRFFLIALSLAELFAFTGIAHSASSIDDNFAGNALDWCRWEDVSYNGTVTQSGELSLSPSGTQQWTNAGIVSQARLVGDFDAQVDYRFGSGLAQSPPSGGLNIALGLYWDEARQITLARTRLANGDGITAYSSFTESAPNNSLYLSETAQAGALRVVRLGNQLNFYFRAPMSIAWTNVGTMIATAAPVHIRLSAFNSGTQQGFTAYLDNFKLNLGSTDDINYTQPTSFNKHEEFAVAAFTENYPVQRYWRGAWKPVDFFDAAAKNGFNWAKTTVSMLSAPELASTPPAQWGTLPWQNSFWSSREWAAETIRQAAARGLRQEVQLTLSQGAAYWGYQNAPLDWAGKSPGEIAPLLEQNVFDTVAYLKGQGLNVERYAIGNEVDIGILDFLPNRRIAVPAGVNFTADLVWLRNAVWPIEAQLLKAAATGVKRADPNAKIILHIAGLEFTHGNVFAPAFFEAMRDLGVPFDYAALSHPYATNPGKLDHYSKSCWFKRLALTTDRISAITGKPLMFVEASYPSAPGSGIVAAPMPDFPFTEAGQAAWIREQLRFASSRPNIVGWHYFYPDMAANVIGATPEEQPLANQALFFTDQQPKPALAEFLVNLAPNAPVIGVPVVGNLQVSIFFTTTQPNAGSPFTTYAATCISGGSNFNVARVASPITITGLANGTTYTCSVTATNAAGVSAPSASVDATPSGNAALALVNIQSRKTHTGIGVFNIDIAATALPNDPVTVEPRVIGSGHLVVFQFNNQVAVPGAVTVIDAVTSTSISGATPAVSGNELVVNIPSLAENQRVVITIDGVNGIAAPMSARIGFLMGDVTNSRAVNASDISAVKARVGQPANLTNFRFDVNTNGSISAQDVSTVKARAGSRLP